jgi:archaellum component FlaF (FlaF/FlaG flagellin family)
MRILQNETVYYTKEFVVDIIQKYEILSVSFPNRVPQGVSAHLIISIQYNGESAEPFSLLLNGREIQTNIDMLVPGENRIKISVVPSSNPYEFGTKIYRIIIEDNDDIEIARLYFAISLELSPMNLVLFYLLPGIIPIGIVLLFINKELKHKKLRR